MYLQNIWEFLFDYRTTLTGSGTTSNVEDVEENQKAINTKKLQNQN
jgi:hypothetical protein